MDKWYFVNKIFDDFVGGFLFYIILVHILKRVASIQRFYRKNSRFSYFLFFWKENITLKDPTLGNFLFENWKKKERKTHFFFIQLKICWNKIKIRKFTYSIKVFIRVFYMFYFLLNLKCNKKITFFFFFFIGSIRTLATLDLESKPHYWLTVCAQDQAVVPMHSCVQVR